MPTRSGAGDHPCPGAQGARIWVSANCADLAVARHVSVSSPWLPVTLPCSAPAASTVGCSGPPTVATRGRASACVPGAPSRIRRCTPRIAAGHGTASTCRPRPRRLSSRTPVAASSTPGPTASSTAPRVQALPGSFADTFALTGMARSSSALTMRTGFTLASATTCGRRAPTAVEPDRPSVTVFATCSSPGTRRTRCGRLPDSGWGPNGNTKPPGEQSSAGGEEKASTLTSMPSVWAAWLGFRRAYHGH